MLNCFLPAWGRRCNPPSHELKPIILTAKTLVGAILFILLVPYVLPEVPTMKLHCPACGGMVRSKLVETMHGTGISYYKGTCTKCDIPVLIEDRSSYEQEGTIEIVLC